MMISTHHNTIEVPREHVIQLLTRMLADIADARDVTAFLYAKEKDAYNCGISQFETSDGTFYVWYTPSGAFMHMWEPRT